MNNNGNLSTRSKLRSAILQIYIIKKAVDGKVLGNKTIHFQINSGNTYRISYKYFMPKGYHLARNVTPDVMCKLTDSGLNIKSVTFIYVKNTVSGKSYTNDINSSSYSHHSAEPIEVNYIDVDNGNRIRNGFVNGNYGQSVNVLNNVQLPNNYVLCNNQKIIFNITDKAQTINLLVTKKRINQDSSNQLRSSSNNTSAMNTKNQGYSLHILRQNIQELQTNLSKYNRTLKNRLIHEIFDHDLNLLKKIITKIFYKMDYKDTNDIDIYQQNNEVSGVVRKGLHNDNRVNATYVRAKKYSTSHQVTISEVRDFVTSVMDHNSSKGVFITTSNFSDEAIREADRHSIVLIDGKKLSQLMIQNSVGVKIRHIYRIANLDHGFFD